MNMGAPNSTRIAIVGASVAGVAAAEALRASAFRGRIDLVDAQHELPYDRPPLSKQFAAGLWDEARLHFGDMGRWRELDVTLRLGCRVVELSRQGRSVVLADGRSLDNDALIIATGADARPLPMLAGYRNAGMLRTLGDARRLRAALRSAKSICLVGSGFIGLEVAAVAVSLGIAVGIVEIAPQPLAARLGAVAARRIQALHERHGVRFFCGRSVAAVEGGDTISALLLDDGARVPADYVLAGVGVVPAVGWLAGSGLAVVDGISCDAFGRTSLPLVYAAGDAAAWAHPATEQQRRIEHWTTARAQGKKAAANLLAELGESAPAAEPLTDIPYAWSDQYGLKVQLVGQPSPAADFRIDFDDAATGFFAGSYWHAGGMTGAVAINQPARVIAYRKALLGSRMAIPQEGAQTLPVG